MTTTPGDGGAGTGPGGGSGTGPKFRLPGSRTPWTTQLIECGRAWGKALDGIARLFTGRPV